MLNNNFISFKGVSYYYDENVFPALNNINANIQRGEFIAILGANGSGKSTLAKHMNALLLPSKGEILVDGLNVQKEENIFKIRQKVSMVFQNPDNQLVSTLVEDDVAFGPENLGINPKGIKIRVEDALNKVKMWELRHRQTHTLSGGQKQKVALAGALAMQSEAIVLDEATAMLDPKSRKEILDLLLKLKREQKTTLVLITHVIEEAFLADTIFIMQKGKIVYKGTPYEIIKEGLLLEKSGLNLSPLIKLAQDLRDFGGNIPLVTNVEELVEAICQA